MLHIKYGLLHAQVSHGCLSNHVIVENWTILCMVYILVARQQETHLMHALNTYCFEIENIFFYNSLRMAQNFYTNQR